MAHERREIELWSRDGDGPWARALIAGGRLDLACLGGHVDVDAVYADAAEPGA